MPDETTLNPPSQEPDRQNIDTYPDPIVDIIPFGSVCLFAGASGAGKTIMTTEWIRRWQLGKTIWHRETNCPTAFYYLAADRDWSTYQRAFDRAGVDMSTVRTYCLDEDHTINWKAWTHTNTWHAFDKLRYCLDKLKPTPGGMLIIEPYTPTFMTGNQNEANHAADSVHFLRRLTREYKVTTMASANVVKQKRDEGYVRPQDRIAGSGALVAHSDTQIYLMQGEKPGEPHLFGWVPRLAAPEEFPVRFDPVTRLFRPDQGLWELPAAPRFQDVLNLIPVTGTVQRKDLEDAIAAAGLILSTSTVTRALRELKNTGFIESPTYGFFRRKATH